MNVHGLNQAEPEPRAAPAPGPPNGLKRINADGVTQRQLCMVSIILGIVILTVFYILAFAQASVVSRELGLEECDDLSEHAQCFYRAYEGPGGWSSGVKGMSRANNFIVLAVAPTRQPESLMQDQQFMFEYAASITGEDETAEFSRETVIFNCPALQLRCNPKALAIRNGISRGSYRLAVDFTPETDAMEYIQGLAFFIEYQNPSFTWYFVTSRIVLLAVSALALVLYGLAYSKISREDATFEHRSILMLSILLVLFNDPLYIITVLVPSFPLALISSLFIVMFLLALFLFWLVMLKRVLTEVNQVGTALIDLWKKVYVGVFACILISMCVVLLVVYRFDYRYDLGNSWPPVMIVFWVFQSAMIIGFIVLTLITMCKAVTNYNNISNRGRVFIFMSLPFCYNISMLTWMNGYSSLFTSGVPIAHLMVVGNLYVYLLQYFWRLAPEPMRLRAPPVNVEVQPLEVRQGGVRIGGGDQPARPFVFDEENNQEDKPTEFPHVTHGQAPLPEGQDPNETFERPTNYQEFEDGDNIGNKME